MPFDNTYRCDSNMTTFIPSKDQLSRVLSSAKYLSVMMMIHESYGLLALDSDQHSDTYALCSNIYQLVLTLYQSDNLQHCGQCTGLCSPCLLCIYNELKISAKEILSGHYRSDRFKLYYYRYFSRVKIKTILYEILLLHNKLSSNLSGRKYNTIVAESKVQEILKICYSLSDQKV